MTRAVALALPTAVVTSLRICLRLPLLLLLNGGWCILRIDATESIKPAILANFKPFSRLQSTDLHLIHNRQLYYFCKMPMLVLRIQTVRVVAVLTAHPGY